MGSFQEVRVWVRISHQGPLTLLDSTHQGHGAGMQECSRAQQQQGTCAEVAARSTAGGDCKTRVVAVEAVEPPHHVSVCPELQESRVQVSQAHSNAKDVHVLLFC
jgi:hypothetical protein